MRAKGEAKGFFIAKRKYKDTKRASQQSPKPMNSQISKGAQWHQYLAHTFPPQYQGQ
jgi:hypothetical protein